eukprot:scaffold69485_cov63-Phaeocystis_antarctica.AAC.3
MPSVIWPPEEAREGGSCVECMARGVCVMCTLLMCTVCVDGSSATTSGGAGAAAATSGGATCGAMGGAAAGMDSGGFSKTRGGEASRSGDMGSSGRQTTLGMPSGSATEPKAGLSPSCATS